MGVMKKVYWLLLMMSAVLYALPFLFTERLWWVVFLFPVPLFYLGNKTTLFFIQGFVWGFIAFLMHMSGEIWVLMMMSHEWWLVGLMLGILMVLYYALLCGACFWITGYGIQFFEVKRPIFRLGMWFVALELLIIGIDEYSLWIFGVQEGYPLIHPLLLLVHKPFLLYLLPCLGKYLLTMLFLLVSFSLTVLIIYKNGKALLLVCCVVGVWLLGWGQAVSQEPVLWQRRIQSVPCMVYSTGNDPLVAIKIIASHLKKIIDKYPETDIIIMPESSCNIENVADISELLLLWSDAYIGKKIHFLFGASCWRDGKYYNSLHWIYNGVLQDCFHKKHAMLISERLPCWLDNDYVRALYFSTSPPIEVCDCPRKKLILDNDVFIPYICSEFFFNERADEYAEVPLIVVVNDSLFTSSIYSLYISRLLILLARFKAIQWQRDIVYISYTESLFIDKKGNYREV